MKKWSRRDVLKTGAVAAGACALAPDMARAMTTGRSGRPGGSADADAGRERILLDADWRFHLGHANDPAKDFGYGAGQEFAKQAALFPASKPDFDVSGWRQLDLPHDWAVELPFVQDKETESAGSKPIGRRYPETSVGWYRRELEIPKSDEGRRLWLEFDCAYRDAIAALNGCMLGRNFSGYAPAIYDITDLVDYGGKNILVVRVDASEREGWFYEGAGIYRHVWLMKAPSMHVPPWGVYVTTPHVVKESAVVLVVTDVIGYGSGPTTCSIASAVHDAAGAVVTTEATNSVAVNPRQRSQVSQTLNLPAPHLWSPETPYLYTLVTTVTAPGQPPDRVETPFGVRTLDWDANQGFLLNGQRYELKGTCNHQDHAGVGVALPDRLQYYRIERLKAMGSNALRTSHNPPTAELLDACDRLGMLVLDENRFFSSDEEGISQMERLVRRDRNRACVFAWSMGNEEFTLEWTPSGGRVAESLRDLCHRLDPSRRVTMPMSNGWGSPMTDVLDVMGLNYEETKNPRRNIDVYRAKYPKQPVMGTEVASALSARGEYANTPTYQSAYDVNFPFWGSTAEHWLARYRSLPFLAGGFVWTGFDYRGEPTPYGWPNISSHFGIMDTCGFPKDTWWYYKAWWGGANEPVLHLFPHWNWHGKEGQPIEVWCHSNLDAVELLVNGKSAGTQPVPRNGHVAWKLPYAPGAIEARGLKGGKRVMTDRRETTGPAARVELVPDRRTIHADGADVSVIEVRIVDARGRVVPTAGDEVTFRVTGAARIIGVGNGDPASHEPDKAERRKAFNGLCMAIVQADRKPGAVTIEATAPGLAAGKAVVALTAG